MKPFCTLVAVLLLLIGCVPPPPDLSREAEEAIRQTDKSMSHLAVEQGFFNALLQYADSEMVKFSDGQLPIIGRSAFADSVSGKDGPKTLTWQPVRVWAAMSGELGYSWGNWKFVKPDTTLHGIYFTAWKKHGDGSWKWVLDGGNTTPAP